MKRINVLSLVTALISSSAMAVNKPDLSRLDPPEGTRTEVKRGFIEAYNAIESESLKISLDKKLKGFVVGKVCDSCEEIKVIITPQTKAYANDIEVPLIKASDRIGRYATVIYELETKNVSEIRW